jgi:pyruvate,orthophosphate dikinase
MVEIVRISDGSNKRHSADAVGAKAANLARMASLGLPVPPAFVIPIDLCAAIVAGDAHAERGLMSGLREGIAFLEDVTGKRFGDRRCPLLVSVRSGAARSMPGMLDSVLDVGCTSQAVHGLLRSTGNPRFAWDCRRRFIAGYAEIVLGLDPRALATCLSQFIADDATESDRDLDGEALERLCAAYLTLIDKHDREVPDDPMEQLGSAALAVYRSWMSDRARTYRRLENLDHLPGTAVTVQAMVFGNGGLASGAGVAFSRDPSTGAARPVIEVLFGAQGEDVVSGRRTPETAEAISRSMPALARELQETLDRLEREFRDVQDVEFTIDNGKLWLLQTRAAKRTPRAALRTAIDFVRAGLISPEEGLRRVDALDLDALGDARLVGAADPVVTGVGASGGIAVGRAAFDSTSAERMAACREPVILVRPDISTADVAGFAVAAGIVTAIGGRTAHAALVARQMGKPCIVGCDRINVDTAARRAQFADTTVNESDWISIDGDSGHVYLGRREVVIERLTWELSEVEHWQATVTTRKSA